MDSFEYLYHYTNIEALALILKNRTIRFNSLDKMDDLQEQQTADIKNIGQFCYISSWTSDSAESIPMWNMYASLNLGVRIKLRKNPFKVYDNNAVEISKVINVPVADNTNGEPLRTIIPMTEMFAEGFFSVQAMNKQLLSQVEYTDDSEKLYPHILKEEGKRFTLLLGDLGKYKNLHWKFQNEWRYILTILPFDLKQLVEKSSTFDLPIVANRMKYGLEKQPFPYYDMSIDDAAFEDMEITLSPRISPGSRIIVQNLIEKFNHTARLTETNLVGLI